MLKKIDRGFLFLEEHLNEFRCPICQNNFTLRDYSLVCARNHQFDLSKKGTLHFLLHSVKSDYNKRMLLHRGAMIQSGMYQPLIDQLAQVMAKEGKTVDVGCGEGSFLKELTENGLVGTKIGFDLSKDAIYLASDQPVDVFWCIADLTQLPFTNQSMDTILNIFSPSHYSEFKRVLKKDGLVVKVIPEENYLKELRVAFYPNDSKKQTYSNEKVRAKFAEEMSILTDKHIQFVFKVPQERRLDLLEMSPLEWQVDPKIKKELKKAPLEEVTVDVRMLVGGVKSNFL